jgi:hypothetical protein
MMIELKGLDGAAVIVNTDHVIFIGQAGDERKNPILGASVVGFVGGANVAVKGSPADIAKLFDEMFSGRVRPGS